MLCDISISYPLSIHVKSASLSLGKKYEYHHHHHHHRRHHHPSVSAIYKGRQLSEGPSFMNPPQISSNSILEPLVHLFPCNLAPLHWDQYVDYVRLSASMHVVLCSCSPASHPPTSNCICQKHMSYKFNILDQVSPSQISCILHFQKISLLAHTHTHQKKTRHQVGTRKS